MQDVDYIETVVRRERRCSLVNGAEKAGHRGGGMVYH